VIFAVEFAVIGALSPELGEGLVRLGYAEPCELRTLAEERTLTALRRSAQWRRHAGMITTDEPADMWREMCWRYVVFPSRHADREAEIVFAVYLRQRRPAVLSALVDTATGAVLPWPALPARPPAIFGSLLISSRYRRQAEIPADALAGGPGPVPRQRPWSRGADADADADAVRRAGLGGSARSAAR
jgi:hypothetical protein